MAEDYRVGSIYQLIKDRKAVQINSAPAWGEKNCVAKMKLLQLDADAINRTTANPPAYILILQLESPALEDFLQETQDIINEWSPAQAIRTALEIFDRWVEQMERKGDLVE